MQRFVEWIMRLGGHWVSMLGIIITSVTGCFLLLTVAVEIVSPSANPYASIIFYVIMPVIFVGGLLLIPVGHLLNLRRRRKRAAAGVEESTLQPGLAALLKSRGALRILFFVGGATLINIVLVGVAGQRALGYMDSVAFCGTTCHTVMEPEYVSYMRSPHARVACVVCHIGDGASWTVKAKIDGLRQCWATVMGTWERPIPTPVKDLRPARDTCEKCHWPATFLGKRIVCRMHYQSDEANSALANVLLLKVGGQNPRSGSYEGIHWHVSPDIQVTYEALDDKREKIGKITVTRNGQSVREFLPPGEPSGAVVEQRQMDCVDCHNRPTHHFDGEPELALDRAFRTGLLDVATPFLRELALPLLQREDRPREVVEDSFLNELKSAYEQRHPEVQLDAAALASASKGLATLYRENIFPERAVGWDTYPDHIGHRGEKADIRGCFRCHNDEHRTRDDVVLSQDCGMCHEILAEDEVPGELDDYLQLILFDED